VLDRVALRAGAEQSKLVAESERLSNALLNSISTKLRTRWRHHQRASTLVGTSDPPPGTSPFDDRRNQEAAARLNRLVRKPPST